MELMEYSRRLNTLADEIYDLLGSEVDIFRSEFGIDKPDSLQDTLTRISEQNRLLNIGIVGRVKAGKSSLLNALFFDGQSILPKAATPMTAALTTLKYGAEFSACVEFYSQNDLKTLEARAELYEQRLSDKQQQLYKELVNRYQNDFAQRGKEIPSESEIKRRAEDAAIKELRKDLSLDAAYDQIKRIRESGINPASLDQQATINAASPEALAERLADYVGVNGCYMPFTKIVHISMPLEELRDIQVVDTPGLNDPVQSREERTVELLKACDVVFIVSPSGQFLNEHDLEIMGRITAREGVQELVLVASQIDTQLYGSEKRARLPDALTNIKNQLAKRAAETLSALKKSNPEVGNVFDSLIHSTSDHLLYSSGVSHSLAVNLERVEKQDENELHTWQQLADNYPDYFSLENLEVSRNSLDMLANIKALRECLAGVRGKKEKITQEKYAVLTKSKGEGLDDFRAKLIQSVRRQAERVENSDGGNLSAQLRSLDAQRSKLSLKIDPIFEDVTSAYRDNLNESLRSVARDLLDKTSVEVNSAGKESTGHGTREKSGVGNLIARKLWGGGSESYTYIQHTVMSASAASAIRRFISDIGFKLSEISRSCTNDFNKNLSRNMTVEIEEILGDECDVDMIFQAIRSVIKKLPAVEFDLGIELPDNLKPQGTLHGVDAETYKNHAANYISDMENQVTKKIERFMRDIKDNAPLRISDAFVDDLEGKIRVLKDQQVNAAQTIALLQSFMAKLKELKE